jgi:magnesium transporter
MRRAMCKSPGGSMLPVDDEAEIVAAMKAPDKVLWVDIERPNGDDLRLLQEGFGFHPLSVRDVAESHSAPKLDDYDRYVFQIVMAPQSVTEGRVRMVELSIYYLAGTLVTVRDEPWPVLDHLWEAVVRDPVRELGKGAQIVYHNVVDRAVQAYESVIAFVEDEIDILEKEVLDADDGIDSLSTIFRLRRSVRHLMRLVLAQQESVLRLAAGHVKSLRKETCYLFRDVADHLRLYHGLLDDHRETLSGLRDTYIGVASNRLNEIMKTLTVFSALLLPLTFLTGLWGMNFDVLPFAQHPLGFWMFLALCLSVVGGLVYLMWRAGWLRRV